MYLQMTVDPYVWAFPLTMRSHRALLFSISRWRMYTGMDVKRVKLADVAVM